MRNGESWKEKFVRKAGGWQEGKGSSSFFCQIRDALKQHIRLTSKTE